MIKVLQINSVVNTGSTGRIAEEIGEVIIDHDWESYIAYGRKSNDSSSKLIKIGTNMEVYSHVLSSKLFDNHGAGSRLGTVKFINEIRKLQPNIIHLHNIHGYYLNIELFFKFLSNYNRPVVWTLHDCWSYTGHCSFYTAVNCQKWKNQCYECEQLQEYPSSLWIDNSSNNFRNKKLIFNSIDNLTLVTVSKWLQVEVEKSFLKNNRIRTIYNGINSEIFKRRINNKLKEDIRLKGKFIILGVANIWDKRKGLDDFIKLAKLLKTNEVIVLIGLNKLQLKNLPDNIVGISKTDNVIILAEYYSLANIFMNLSSEESFGLTTVESMACGTPVVVYDSGASPEIVSKETGFVVKPKDFDKIRDVIEIVKSASKKYQIKCRELVIDRYDKKMNNQLYFKLYQSLLNK